ncbi:MAG: polysaccharide deacetylase family protein [Pelotomaculum sp.]
MKLLKTPMLFVLSLIICGIVCASGIWHGVAVKATGPIYHGNDREKKIALTFNVVWGEEYIPQILTVLKDNNVPATFFIGGQWAEDFPDLTKQIALDGHEVGNHGYSHPHPDNISREANLTEIKQAEAAIENACGVKTRLFAPPYGERADHVLEAASQAGYQTILWSIDTIDWQRPAPSVLVDRVMGKLHHGAIVLLHPTSPTVEALPTIIQELKLAGYEIVTISVLLG